MSTLRVHKITNAQDDGPVEFSKGAILPSGQSIVDENGQSPIEVSTVSGVVTATTFIGSGSLITGLVGASKGLTVGYIYVL